MNPYEIHVTIEHCRLDHFKRYCGDAGVKPLLIDLQLANGGSGCQLMCGKRMMAESFTDVVSESIRLTKFFTSKALNVQRVKIETSTDNKIRAIMNLYYEVHVPVTLKNNEDKESLTDLAGSGWHVSRNAFKRVEEGEVFFLTYRSTWLAELEANLHSLIYILNDSGIQIHDQKIEKELVLVDTMQSLDDDWIGIENTRNRATNPSTGRLSDSL